MRYAERRTAHSAGVVSYNKLEPAGVEVAVEGEGGRRSREPAGSTGAFVYEPYRAARPSPWHGHEKFRRSRSTFARRSKKLLSLVRTLFDRRGRIGSTTECRVASRAGVSDRAPLAEKNFFQRGLLKRRPNGIAIRPRFRRVSRRPLLKPLDFSTSSRRDGDSQSCSRTIV